MNEVIMNTMAAKLDTLETRMDTEHQVIVEMTATVSQVKELGDQLKKVATITEVLQNKMASIVFPVMDMQALKDELAINNEWRANPRKEKVLHVHTGEKLWWWTIGVGLAVVLSMVLWWNTYTKMGEFEMRDILWRTIKLTATKEQLKSLQQIEHDYTRDPKRMQQAVAQEELKQQQILEAKQNQAKAEQEAENWKKAAGDTLKGKTLHKKASKAKQQKKQ